MIDGRLFLFAPGRVEKPMDVAPRKAGKQPPTMIHLRCGWMFISMITSSNYAGTSEARATISSIAAMFASSERTKANWLRQRSRLWPGRLILK